MGEEKAKIVTLEGKVENLDTFDVA